MKKQLRWLVFLSFWLVGSSAWAQGLDNTPIGSTTPSTGAFTNLQATGTFTLGGQTASSLSAIDNKNVKVSSDDSTPGFLNGKLVSGDGITLTENGGGGNETLSISAADKLTNKGDVLTHDGTNETSLPVGADGQVLTADSASPNGVKWGDSGATDENDGVDITFNRQFDYPSGSGDVPAVDLNGTNLYIDPTDPTVTIGGVSANVLFAGDIPNTNPVVQQVVTDIPPGLISGNYKLELTNTQGVSRVFVPLTETTFLDGSTWSSATLTGPSISRHASVVFQNKIWILGGHDGTTYTNNVWKSSNGVDWTSVATAGPIWNVRAYHTALVFTDPADSIEKMWILGGYAGTMYNDIWNSVDGVHWNQVTTIGTIWSGRHVHASVVHNGKMWVIGGQNGSGNFNDVWYSSDGVNWSEPVGTVPWSVRYGHSVLSFNNKLWLLGGNSPPRNNEVWSSSDDGATWVSEVTDADWADRYYHTSVVYNNKMWVISGYTNYYPDVWSSSNGVDWAEATGAAPWVGRGNATSVVFGQKIWVMGGRDNTAATLSDVWFTSE
jgi:hypothetical protein